MANANKSDFFTKMDIANIWGIESIAKFERIVGRTRLEKEVNWRTGYQLFSPNQVRTIIGMLGEPMKQSELSGLQKKEK